MLPTMTLEILQVPGCPGADLLAARLDGLLAGCQGLAPSATSIAFSDRTESQ
jgi:hypothetical protein